MAKEFKLPYTASEISEKLEKIDNKADLINGKVPLEQLPNNIGSGGGLTEVSWEDVKNKPFYDTRVISTYSYTENPNPVSFDHQLMGYSFYKVSDLVLTKEEIFNTKITIDGYEVPKYSQNNILIETDEIIAVQEAVNNGWAFCFCNTVGTCNFTFSGYSLSVDIPETGIYRANFLNGGMSDISTIEILVSGELKQIDPKFIPADLDFNLDDYYTKSEVDKVIGNIDLSGYYTKNEIDNLIGDIDTVLDEINILIGE